MPAERALQRGRSRLDKSQYVITDSTTAPGQHVPHQPAILLADFSLSVSSCASFSASMRAAAASIRQAPITLPAQALPPAPKPARQVLAQAKALQVFRKVAEKRVKSC